MIGGLDHINIETTDLAASVRFYEGFLGLTRGWRPDFGVDGAWMYVGEQPIIHLVVRERVFPPPTGPIHHVALLATGLEATKAKLEAHGMPYDVTVVPDVNVAQIFVEDPNGVRLELNFYDEGVST